MPNWIIIQHHHNSFVSWMLTTIWSLRPLSKSSTVNDVPQIDAPEQSIFSPRYEILLLFFLIGERSRKNAGLSQVNIVSRGAQIESLDLGVYFKGRNPFSVSQFSFDLKLAKATWLVLWPLSPIKTVSVCLDYVHLWTHTIDVGDSRLWNVSNNLPLDYLLKYIVVGKKPRRCRRQIASRGFVLKKKKTKSNVAKSPTFLYKDVVSFKCETVSDPGTMTSVWII